MSISELIYQSNKGLISNSPIDLRVEPDDYPQLAEAAKELGVDIRIAYGEALAEKEDEERESDRYFLDRAKDYVELNEQVETSTKLLTDLSSFLSTFQSDLSAVSGHIAELQGRSKTIERRLESRKAVERSLHPLLHSIVISPSLINLIVETEVGDDWIPAVIELDAKLGAIRSGPRIENRKSLDDVAEALRIKAAQKILAHLVSILKPFAISISPSLPDLHSTTLLPLKPLFDFLRRHSARQAHEFQKAYISTIRWYYETGFRRYIRGLEKVRLRVGMKHDLIGVVSAGAEASLALLSKRNSATVEIVSTSIPALEHSQIEGPDIILAYMGSDKNLRPAPEALFRSLALVLLDNSQTEYNFITTFFGQHSDLPVLPSRSPVLTPSGSSTPLPLPSTTSSRESSIAGDIKFERKDSMDTDSMFGYGRGGGGSDSGRGSISGSLFTKEEREEKLRKTMIEGVWKGILEPALEYSQSFVNALIDPSPPPPISLLSMIRLNETLLSLSQCPPLESYLINQRMYLWPTYAKQMNLEIESLKKINGSYPLGGVFSGSKNVGINVKDSVVMVVGMRFVEMFNSAVVLTGEQDEEMVFSSLIRLRIELDKLLIYQSEKIPDLPKRNAFLSTHYEELLQGLSSGKSTHTRSQQTMAYYKELIRKLS